MTRRQRQVAAVLNLLEADDISVFAAFKESEVRAMPRVGTVTVNEIVRQLRKKKLSLTKQEGYRPMPEAVKKAWNKYGRQKGWV